jgi:hypothetical protein
VGGEWEVRRKEYLKRIERLEAFALALRVEDAKRRHLEAWSKMSDEELASLYFAAEQLKEVRKEDPGRAEELIRTDLAATEHFEERARLGWQRLCETDALAALLDFVEATEGKVSPSGTPWDDKLLFERQKLTSSRNASVRLHKYRLATESEKRDLCERFPSLKKLVGNDS